MARTSTAAPRNKVGSAIPSPDHARSAIAPALPRPAQAPQENSPNDVVRRATATVEVIWCLMEFMLFLMLSRDALRFGAEQIFGVPSFELPSAVWVLITTLSTSFVLFWSMFRYANLDGISIREFAFRLGIHHIRLSKIGLLVVAIHGVSSAVMVGIQHYTGRWIFGFDNYYKGEALDYQAAAEMLVLAPVREEILFRGVIYAICHKRLRAPNENPASKSSRLRGAIWCGLLFGLVHMMNLGGKREYKSTYIALQVILGALIGVFYSLADIRAGTIWESTIMHFFNNIFSSFLPLNVELDFYDPLIGLPLLNTLLVYSTLIYMLVRTLPGEEEDSITDADLAADAHSHRE